MGWGVIVPDEDAYHKHAVMQARAKEALASGQYALAKQMYERCLAYLDGLGPHWLGSARRVTVAEGISICACELKDIAAAETVLLDAKRIAQRDMGPSHRATIRATWGYAYHLMKTGSVEKARSLFEKTDRLRGGEWGPKHTEEIETQVSSP